MVSRLRGKPNVIFASLSLAGFSYAVSQTLLIPSLPDIEEAFHTTPSGVTTLMTAFWICGALTAGVFGRLGDMFGKRRMIVAQMALFSLGAVVCGLAPALPLMIAGRILMGCGMGIFPLAYSLIADELPPRKVVGAIALLGGTIAAGAAIGQSTGGLVTDGLGFRWIFWISLIMGALSIVALLAFVPESSFRTSGKVDVGGACLLAAGLAAPLVAVAQTPFWGWADPRTIGLALLGVALLAVFVRYESKQEEPLIDLPTLRLPRVRLTNTATFFVGVGLFGNSAILTQFFQESGGYGPGASATQAGLFLVPGLVLLAVTSPLAGRLSTRVGPTLTLRLGIAIATIGLAGMALSHDCQFEMYLWPTIVYLGLGGTFGAMPTIVLESVPPERGGESAGINLIVRTVGSALGVQLAASLVTSSGLLGHPTDQGYTSAFALEAIAGAIALLFALRIPRRLGSSRIGSARGSAPLPAAPPS